MRHISVGLLVLAAACLGRTATNSSDTTVHFLADSRDAFSESERERVVRALEGVTSSVRTLLPELPADVAFEITVVSRDLSTVGGVTGRADAPGRILIEFSSSFPGGLAGGIEEGLAGVAYHELHHLVRGWTIEGNRFGPGIPIAMVNEGLASIFSEIYSGTRHSRFDYPEEAEAWLEELLALPVDADYNTWMNEHPDGRIAMGYRIGRYVVEKAMAQSGRSIIALSSLAPEDVLSLAGVEWPA